MGYLPEFSTQILQVAGSPAGVVAAEGNAPSGINQGIVRVGFKPRHEIPSSLAAQAFFLQHTVTAVAESR